MTDAIDPQVANELACKARDARERCARNGHSTMWRDAGDHLEWFCGECGAEIDRRSDKRT